MPIPSPINRLAELDRELTASADRMVETAERACRSAAAREIAGLRDALCAERCANRTLAHRLARSHLVVELIVVALVLWFVANLLTR